jgi:hypothetical protein
MTSPCRTCSLGDSDKNNSTCMKCSRRVVYVHALGRDLCFASSRSGLESPAPRFSMISRQAQFLTSSPEIFYE